MKRFVSIKQHLKLWSVSLLSLVIVMGFSSVSHAEWKYGIGTGMFLLNLDGDIGLTTNIAGPVTLDVDLDSSDINDLMETAFGFGGYASDGTWRIKYGFSYMDLKGDSKTSQSGITVDAELEFEATGAELTVGYPIYKDPSVNLTLDAGLRYTKHEITSRTNITGAVTENLKKDLDNDWTDFLLGATIAFPFDTAWNWSTNANAGYGGSEGTYLVSTGVTWRFIENWSGTLYGKYTAVDFEEGSSGDSDWYKYDVDEYGAGITILYNF